MKNFRLIAVSLMFAAIFAVSASAQTATKIALINSAAFENDTAGVTKMLNERKKLDAEFTPIENELKTLQTSIQTLNTELRTIQGQINALAAQADPSKLQATYAQKYGELEDKSREFKFKEEAAKARYARREQVLMAPIMQDIGKAMQDYSKSKGYTVIFDAAKLYNAGVLLAWDETTDVTADFIKFYNARPATATTTTTK